MLFSLLILLSGCGGENGQSSDDIVIENEVMKLVINSKGYAESLIHKTTGEELLAHETMVPLCEITFLRRRAMRWTEGKGDHPAKCEKNTEHRIYSNSVKKQGDELLVEFEGIKDTLILGLDNTDNYLGFLIKDWVGHRGFQTLKFFQLPVKEKEHFGDWINVMWDENVAAGILATDPCVHIQDERRNGCRVLNATAYDEIKIENIGVALVVSETGNLLDHIDKMEEDYGLPRGVMNRREERYADSYFWAKDPNVLNIDQNIRLTKQMGFPGLMITYNDFSKAAGHYEWNSDYPNGMADLKEVVSKIKAAGLMPLLHIHYNKATKNDPYVTGTPDHRLNLAGIFTLSRPLNPEDTIVWVEEDPYGMTLDNNRRILKVGNELIEYSSYNNTRPYKFEGCKRGILETQVSSHPLGLKMGVLDVDSWVKFVRYDQRTSIQEEVAQRVADIYNECGFQSIYYDGAEDVHPPDWYNVSKCQMDVHKKLNTVIFGEGAVYSHFSWHMLSRGNPWDTQGYLPEELKDAVREESCAQAPRMLENFSLFTFVRLAYHPPGPNTMGIQPDHLEFVCSRAAAWDLPISIWDSYDNFEKHPRTKDNLEVVRSWEKVKTSRTLSEDQKEMLKDSHQEHILYKNEQGEFEIFPYEQISDVAEGDKSIRAFIFDRNGSQYVVFWHTSGKANIELTVSPQDVVLLEEAGRESVLKSGTNDKSVILPVSNRRYLITEKLTREQIITAFNNAAVMN